MADLPIWDAFQGAIDRNVQRGSANMQQLGALQGILSQQQQQQAKQAALAKEYEYRGALSRATTDEERMAIAANAMGPEGLMKHYDTRAKADQTKQIALMNLRQKIATETRHAYEFAQTLPIKKREIALKEIQANATNLWHAGSLAIQKGNLDYNVVGDNSGIGDVVSRLRSMGTSAPAAQQDPYAMPVSQPTTDERAAMAQLRPLAQGGGSVEVVPQAAPAPALSPAPQAALQPEAAPSWIPAPQSNADSRDLRLSGLMRDMTPQNAIDQGMPTYQSPPPAAPEMPKFSGSPSQVAEAQNRWNLQQTQAQNRDASAANRASIAGSGVPTKETAAFVARQYLNGNDQAISGYARSVPAKLVIMDAIRTEAERQGLSPEAVNARIAEFQGTKAASRTIGTRSAGIAMAAEEAQQAIQIVKDTSANFQRTNFVPWNYALKAYDTNTGRPEIVEFGAAINALVNTYARALSPSGIPTVSDKEHARAILNTIQSPAQVDGVLNVINRELEIAKRAPKAVREQIRRDVTGGNGPAVGTVQDGYRFKGGNAGDQNNWERI